MNILAFLYGSSLGRKYVMAVTGILLFLFVIVHMLGNLQIFLGPAAINEYAEALKSRPWLLWPARIGLLAVFLLHISAAIQLAIENRQARPVKYAAGKPIASSYAARTIVITGLVVLAFIAFHLAHFTFLVVDRQFVNFNDLMGRHDVYRMMVAGFSNPAVAAFYIISMGLLCLHLSHGIASTFQSLGLRNQKTVRGLKAFGTACGVLVFLGNCSIPIAILAGMIK